MSESAPNLITDSWVYRLWMESMQRPQPSQRLIHECLYGAEPHLLILDELPRESIPEPFLDLIVIGGRRCGKTMEMEHQAAMHEIVAIKAQKFDCLDCGEKRRGKHHGRKSGAFGKRKGTH